MGSADQEMKPAQAMRRLRGARDGDTAVGPHDGYERGLGVLGAGLDEYGGLARPSASEGRGRARYVQDRGVFSFRVTPTVATSRTARAAPPRSLRDPAGPRRCLERALGARPLSFISGRVVSDSVHSSCVQTYSSTRNYELAFCRVHRPNR